MAMVQTSFDKLPHFFADRQSTVFPIYFRFSLYLDELLVFYYFLLLNPSYTIAYKHYWDKEKADIYRKMCKNSLVSSFPISYFPTKR